MNFYRRIVNLHNKKFILKLSDLWLKFESRFDKTCKINSISTPNSYLFFSMLFTLKFFIILLQQQVFIYFLAYFRPKSASPTTLRASLFTNSLSSVTPRNLKFSQTWSLHCYLGHNLSFVLSDFHVVVSNANRLSALQTYNTQLTVGFSESL